MANLHNLFINNPALKPKDYTIEQYVQYITCTYCSDKCIGKENCIEYQENMMRQLEQEGKIINDQK